MGALAPGPVVANGTGHSCGSAPDLHRLPPFSASPYVRRTPVTDRHSHPVPALVWLLWAMAAAASVQLAPNPLYVALVVAIAALVVEGHAVEGPLRGAFPVVLLAGVAFATLRLVLTVATTHGTGDVLFTLPQGTLPTILGGFTVGGTVETPVLVRPRRRGSPSSASWPPSAPSTPWSRTTSSCWPHPAPSTRSASSSPSPSPSCPPPWRPSARCARPTGPAPAAGSCGGVACSARSCPSWRRGWSGPSPWPSRWTRGASATSPPGRPTPPPAG